MPFEVHTATEKDASLILHFINELAIYEKALDEVVATEEDIRASLFGEEPSAQALIAADGDEPVGFAVYFFHYSTWLGKKGLFLEDLYVSPAHRGRGFGKKLLKHLARIAVSEDCGRFEWNVLDWNKPAIEFYDSLGARPQDQWITYRLAGDALEELARA